MPSCPPHGEGAANSYVLALPTTSQPSSSNPPNAFNLAPAAPKRKGPKKRKPALDIPRDAHGRFVSSNIPLPSPFSPAQQSSTASSASPIKGFSTPDIDSGSESWSTSAFSSSIPGRIPVRRYSLHDHTPYDLTDPDPSPERPSSRAESARSGQSNEPRAFEFILPSPFGNADDDTKEASDAEPAVPPPVAPKLAAPTPALLAFPKTDPDEDVKPVVTRHTHHIPTPKVLHKPLASFTKPIKLQSSAPTATPTLAVPTTPAMASTQQFPGLTFFKGTGEDNESPKNFIRLFRRYMEAAGKSPSPDWVTTFENYLYEDSPAEEWYITLDPQFKGDWATFETAFLNRWKLAKKAVKSTSEIQQEMLEYKLKEEALGTKEIIGGREVWSHVRWAQHMLELATKAGITSTNQNIWLIRREMPDLMKEFMGETHANWMSFAQTVMDVDVTKLRDKVEAKHRRDSEYAHMQAEVQCISAQLQRLTIPQQQYTTAPGYRCPATATPVSNRPPAAPNPQTNTTRRDLVRTAMNALPHHPNTDAGRTAYQAQMARFTERHGLSPYITEHTPVPLTPGTEPLCSGECWTCGQKGHRVDSCEAPAEARVPDTERRWRSFCQRTMRDTQPRMQYVGTGATYEPRVPWADQLTEEELQGNGQGPPV